MSHTPADAAASAASATAKAATTYGGLASSAFGWFVSNQALVGWGGLCVAACGLALQAWLGVRQDRRNAAEHEARMGHLRSKGRSPTTPGSL